MIQDHSDHGVSRNQESSWGKDSMALFDALLLSDLGSSHRNSFCHCLVSLIDELLIVDRLCCNLYRHPLCELLVILLLAQMNRLK